MLDATFNTLDESFDFAAALGLGSHRCPARQPDDHRRLRAEVEGVDERERRRLGDRPAVPVPVDVDRRSGRRQHSRNPVVHRQGLWLADGWIARAQGHLRVREGQRHHHVRSEVPPAGNPGRVQRDHQDRHRQPRRSQSRRHPDVARQPRRSVAELHARRSVGLPQRPQLQERRDDDQPRRQLGRRRVHPAEPVEPRDRRDRQDRPRLLEEVRVGNVVRRHPGRWQIPRRRPATTTRTH